MRTEPYKGRKLTVRKNGDGGLTGAINGQPMPARYGVPAGQILEQFHRDIDLADQEPVNGDRWGAYMYAAGTYTMCGEGIHPVAIGGQCRHVTCARKRQDARPPISRVSGDYSYPAFLL